MPGLKKKRAKQMPAQRGKKNVPKGSVQWKGKVTSYDTGGD